MGNLLRLVWIALGAWISPRRLLLAPSIVSLRVWPNDMDLNFHMNNGRYLSLMDLGRVDLMFRGGVGLWFLKGWKPLVATSFCRHFKALGLFDAYQLHTRILAWDEKWIYIEHRFLRQGELCAIGAVKTLVVGRGGPIPTPELFRATGGEPRKSPALPRWVRDWLAAEASVIARLKSETGGRP